jgi:hypothetical protein
VPSLAWSEGPGLLVSGEDFSGWFDPDDATLATGVAALHQRVVWRPAEDGEPSVRRAKENARSSVTVRLDLRYQPKEERWSGTGVLEGRGVLSSFDRVSGLGTEARSFLGRVAGSVMEGAEIKSVNPEAVGPSRVAVGFAIEAPAGERDDLGRLRLALGDTGALLPLLDHAAVHVYEESRDSAVVLPGEVEHRVVLVVDPGDLEIVHLPETRTVANGAGRCVVSASDEKDEIVFTRMLVLSRGTYAAEDWPELRTLLLADRNEGNRVLLLK